MVREIKFKAWDKSAEMMIEPEGDDAIFMNLSGKQFLITSYKQLPELVIKQEKDYNGKDRYLFLQYTGLKDKNGKEIYEGDIIKFNEDWIYKVIWEEGSRNYLSGYTVEQIKGEPNIIPDNRMYMMGVVGEVIGNKFENPELMKWYSLKMVIVILVGIDMMRRLDVKIVYLGKGDGKK